MVNKIENPDFVTRNSKFCKIVNMLVNLDLEDNLELDYYELTTQVSPSIFDNTTFKDKQGICTVDVHRYIVGDNPPIYFIRLMNKNFSRDESFWIENPPRLSDRLNGLIMKYHDLEKLDSFGNVIEDIYMHNKKHK